MDIKEATEVLMTYEYTAGDYERIIDLIKELDKYKLIVEELENDYGFLGHRYSGSDSTDYLRFVIPRLKQKYFPKEK